MPSGRRRLSWAQIAILRRSARKRERFIAEYRFPDYIWKRARKRIADAGEADLHHTPDEAMSTPMGNALGETVRAWDRSDAGQRGESVIWDLDEQLGIAEPLGIDGLQLASIRASVATAEAGAAATEPPFGL